MSCLPPETVQYLVLARIKFNAGKWGISEDKAVELIKDFINDPDKAAREVTREPNPNDRRAFILYDFKSELEFWESVKVPKKQVYEAVMSF
jgi:hypothetical protein